MLSNGTDRLTDLVFCFFVVGIAVFWIHQSDFHMIEGQIQKSPRWRKLYGNKLPNDTPYDLVEVVVEAVHKERSYTFTVILTLHFTCVCTDSSWNYKFTFKFRVGNVAWLTQLSVSTISMAVILSISIHVGFFRHGFYRQVEPRGGENLTGSCRS